ARASLVLLHSPERGLQVRATQHAVQQVARSRGLTGPIRRRHFHAPSVSRGFTPTHEREPQLFGHLRHSVSENRGCFPSPSFGPSLRNTIPATTASADSSLRS